MNILSIFYKDKRGGFNQRLYKLYESLAAEKHSLYFIGTERLPIKNKKVFQHIIKTPFSKQENAIFWLSFIILSFLETLIISRRRRITRIITFGPFYTTLCVLPICLIGIPAVTFIRADNMKHSRNIFRNTFFYFVDWIGIKLSDKIFFVSLKLKKVYQARYRIPEKNIRVIPNNIEESYQIDPREKIKIRQSLGIEQGEFLVSTSGVFNRGKNFALLIRVMKHLHVHGIKLLIIGDEVVPKDEKYRLEKLTRDLELQGCVMFCGWQDTPLHFIASSDLFVFPSKYEGSPNALLEALSCGIPCLGSNIDEIKEILAYDELLFMLGDDDNLVEMVKRARVETTFYDRIKYLSNKRCRHFLFAWGIEVLRRSFH